MSSTDIQIKVEDAYDIVTNADIPDPYKIEAFNIVLSYLLAT